MLIKRLRQLRYLVERPLLIQSISKESCIVEKRRNLFQKERDTELSNFWNCIAPKKTEQEHESKNKRKVANIILLLWSPTI